MKITKETKRNQTTTTLKFDSKEDGIVNEYTMLTQAGIDTRGVNPAEVGYGKGTIKETKITFKKQPNKIISVLFVILVIILITALFALPIIF